MYQNFKRANQYEWFTRLFKKQIGGNYALIISEAQKLTEEDVSKIKEDIGEFSQSIRDIQKSHSEDYQKIIKKIEEICVEAGVIYKNHNDTHERWFKNLLDRFSPLRSFPGNFGDIRCGAVEYNGETLWLKDINFIDESISNIINKVHRLVDGVIKHVSRRDARKEKNNKLFRKAIEIAIRDKVNYGEMSDEDLIKHIIELEENKHLESRHGETIDFDQCDDCDKWTVGERRCSCGNRRVSLELDGNLIDGFYSYPQAY